MALYAYNKTTSLLALAVGSATVRASLVGGQRGPALNVTAELRPNLTVDPARGVAGGLSAADYTALEAQRAGGSIDYEWTSDPEYVVSGLAVGGPAAGLHAVTHIGGGLDAIPLAVASGAAGLQSGADKAKLDGVGVAAPPGVRQSISGAGLIGGGDFSADRTHAVGANPDGSIVVNADDIQVGILATDGQHGSRGGGSLHANVVAAGASGFMSGPDKTKLDGIGVAAPPGTRQLIAGAGLIGGGDLSADRTHTVGANPDGSIVVNADDIQVGVLATDGQHGSRGGGTQHAVVVAAGAAGFMSGADKTKLDGVGVAAPPGTRTVSAAGLATGGGDLSADRTITVTAGLLADIQPAALAAAAGASGRAADAAHVHAMAPLLVYSNAGRPAANSFAAGFVIFNSDDKKPNYTDGADWYDAAGNLT